MNGDDKKPKTMVPGMNLLDWYAGQALASIAVDRQNYISPEEVARKAYKFAEAMVAEKNRRAK